MPTAMTMSFKVTFEFATRSPITREGTVEGSSAAVCMRRAVRSVQREVKPRNWVAANCLLMDRAPRAQSPSGDAHVAASHTEASPEEDAA